MARYFYLFNVYSDCNSPDILEMVVGFYTVYSLVLGPVGFSRFVTSTVETRFKIYEVKLKCDLMVC